MKLSEAKERFESAGLVCDVKPSKSFLYGGVSRSDSNEITIYKDSFNLEKLEDEWVARVPGEGMMVVESICSSLDEAVDFIIKHYSVEHT